MENNAREKGVSEWKELVDGPWLGLAIGLLAGSAAAVAPNASLPWIFGAAWVASSIHLIRHLLRRKRWRTRLIANCIVIPIIGVGLFKLERKIPKFREPATVDEIADAVVNKMSQTKDVNTQSATTQARPEEKPEASTLKTKKTHPPKKPPEKPAPSPQPQQPPAIQAHLSISQSREVSTRQDAPTATKVVIQTDHDFSSLKLVLQCDGPLVDGRAVVGSGSMVQMMVSSGIVKDHPNLFVYSYGSSVPQFGPANPLIITLWSKDPVTCDQAATF